MKNSLGTRGLSMSEAQSISNVCHQKALDIQNELSIINNFSKTVKIGDDVHIITQGNPIPSNILELISLKAKFHATQAFLMENIKAKEALLISLKNKNLEYEVQPPIMKILTEPNLLGEVDETWGRAQLSLTEVNDYLLEEANAAHIGQFIHSKSKLDNLRKELPTLATLDWMEVETGKKTPITVTPHHTNSQLSTIYEDFSAQHRVAEQKVNFIKAKIKNLITAENARIAEVNALEISKVNDVNSSLREENTTSYAKWRGDYSVAQAKFEERRNKEIQEVASLKIVTASQFQDVVDSILKTLKK